MEILSKKSSHVKCTVLHVSEFKSKSIKNRQKYLKGAKNYRQVDLKSNITNTEPKLNVNY